MKPIKNVTILGSGTMGQQIAFQCASCGFDVIVYDISQEALDKAEKRLPKLCKNLVAMNRIKAENAEAAKQRLRYTTDAEVAGKDADIINESVPEDPAIKAKIFSQFYEICPEHTLFTTNTSTLVPSMFAAETGRPEKFVALHFHDVALTNMVDIMPHPGTSQETIDAVEKFTYDIEQYPIMLKKEQPGYVFNTMLSQLMAAALTLAANDVATPEEIDKAWMGILRVPLGPFGMMDSIGLETVWKVTEFWAKKTKDKQSLANAEFLKTFVDAGTLGIKSGKGIYQYPEPEYLKPSFLEGVR